jgi:hypothetical protein
MPTYTLRCCLCDDWHEPDLVHTQEHGMADHGIPRDELAQAKRRKHLVPGRIIYEWTLPDGRLWLRAERRPLTAAEESASQDVQERGEEVAAAVLSYLDTMAPEHALSHDSRWRLWQSIIRQVCYVLQSWPAREAVPPRRKTAMVHLTLNTGDSRDSPRSEVNESVLTRLTRLVRCGYGRVPDLPYNVTIIRTRCDAVFTIATRANFLYGVQPIVTCGVAQQWEVEIWGALCRLMDPTWSQGPQATMPLSRPWVAVVLWPAATLVPPDDFAALIEFERCLAWAIIEETPHE